MIERIYLGIVAAMYLALAIWCTVSPATTSEKVGFELNGNAGQSEFITVYGGLEFGLALVLIAAMFRADTLTFGVLACVLIHGSLVLFRTYSFFQISDIPSFTRSLAIGEWVILLSGIATLVWAYLRK
ncbi:MAG: DUF4345 family protein [Planctomycetota bacterium]